MVTRILDSIAKKPSIGVVGLASWDTLLTIDRYPNAGECSLISSRVELPGGTSANAAAAAAALHARVELFSAVGSDSFGNRLKTAIAGAGVDVSQTWIDKKRPTDQTTVISSARPFNRTIFWEQGAYPRRGDRIDIDRLFTRDLVILDSVDPGLRRFLIDLPVHTYPNTRILVPMTYVIDYPGRDELESVLRCDALVGSEAELFQLTGCDSLTGAIRATQEMMRISNLRYVAVTSGAVGATAFDADTVHKIEAISVEVVDPTGAGDAFAGAFAVGLASRMGLEDALALANAVAGLSTRAIGAQAALPTLQEIASALGDLDQT